MYLYVWLRLSPSRGSLFHFTQVPLIHLLSVRCLGGGGLEPVEMSPHEHVHNLFEVLNFSGLAIKILDGVSERKFALLHFTSAYIWLYFKCHCFSIGSYDFLLNRWPEIPTQRSRLGLKVLVRVNGTRVIVVQVVEHRVSALHKSWLILDPLGILFQISHILIRQVYTRQVRALPSERVRLVKLWKLLILLLLVFVKIFFPKLSY